jgi:hypothetical protein
LGVELTKLADLEETEVPVFNKLLVRAKLEPVK